MRDWSRASWRDFWFFAFVCWLGGENTIAAASGADGLVKVGLVLLMLLLMLLLLIMLSLSLRKPRDWRPLGVGLDTR